MRVFLLVSSLLFVVHVNAVESEKNPENRCANTVNQNTEYKVSGIYGSSLESEWHPAGAYVLRKEMQKYEVLQREFQLKTDEWRFEFAEMVGGKTIVFVFHHQIQTEFCAGPNAFFVQKR